MRNFLDKNFNEILHYCQLRVRVGVTVNNGNFPHLQTAETWLANLTIHMVPYPHM